MEQQYITVVTTLSSVLVGSGFTLLVSFLTNRSTEKRHQSQLQHDANQRKQELLRTRGEELYMVTSAWLKLMAVHHLRMVPVMLGNITYDQALDMELAESKPLLDFERIEMLVDTYFPSVRDSYDAVLVEREKTNEIQLAFKREYQKVGPSTNHKQFLPAYEKSLMAMEELGKNLRVRIVESLRSIPANSDHISSTIAISSTSEVPQTPNILS